MSQSDRLTERFNVSAWAIRHQALVFFFVVLATVAGLYSYTKLAQSEDPPFTFRVMVIQTMWPGATALQVEEHVTKRIERTLQEMPNRYYTRSYSKPGESLVFYAMSEAAPAGAVADEWYQVRKKIGDIAVRLPKDVIGPFFNDEFGDVYTNIYALRGDGFDWAELKDEADTLRTVLLGVDGIEKVDYFGEQTERITVEISNSMMASLAISPADIAKAITEQNAVQSAGVVNTATDRIFVRTTGQYASVEAIANTYLDVDGKPIMLGSIAHIERGYSDPPDPFLRANGTPVLGIGITASQGHDVVALGKKLDGVIVELQQGLKMGLALDEVASMPEAVSSSVDEFLRAVAEAVVIVLLVCLVSLGLRTGMIVVISIPVVLALTALLMHWLGIGLHKVSLGTLVLALGLLVDDAILAIEMMAVKLDQGWDRARAAAFAFTSTAFPMLTGTFVTIAGFLPIALAKSSTGEYTRSIFEVSTISLLVSWIVAILLIPLLGYYLLRRKPRPGTDLFSHESTEINIYDTRFYRRLRGYLLWCVDHKVGVLAITLMLFALSLFAFRFIPQQFFPESDRPELIVDLRLPESASIHATAAEVERLDAMIKNRPEIRHWLSFVGTGAPRFYLPLDEQLPQPNLAQLVITTASLADREQLADWLEPLLETEFSAVRTRLSRLEMGPPVGYPLQLRVSGDDISQVREWALKVSELVRGHSAARNVQFDWDEPGARSLRFELDHEAVSASGLTAKDVAGFLAMNIEGVDVSEFQEGDKRIAVKLRAPEADRNEPSRLLALSIPTAQGAVPLASLGTFVPVLEYGVIWERNRLPTITVRSDVEAGVEGITLTNELRPKLDALRAELPVGYVIEVGGAVEESAKAQRSIVAQLLIMVIAVFSFLMIQLQSITRVLLVIVTAPLGLIGVAITLLLFGQPFGFVAMLGVIAMFGIIMRNSVILLDQIEQDIQAGHQRGDAILDATVRRFRPISLTAAASVLGLIPLLRSNFFGPMASALMGGITIATLLTIFVLPAMYAIVFKVSTSEREEVSS